MIGVDIFDVMAGMSTKSERLKEMRLRAGFSKAAEAARRLGMSATTYAAHENGQNEFNENWAMRYARLFNVPWEYLLTGKTENFDPASKFIEGERIPVLEFLGQSPPQQRQVASHQADVMGTRDLPVYTAVEGGSGEIVVSTDPIDHVPRPWYMGAVKDGFAVLVVGESMIPAFRPGDMAIVNPRLPPMRGKDHILINDGIDGSFRATIKRIETWTESEWLLEQYNPPEGAERSFRLPRSEWAKALRVVGRYDS